MTNNGLTFKRVAGICGVSTHTLKDNIVHLLEALPIDDRISVLEQMLDNRISQAPAPQNLCPDCGSESELLATLNPHILLRCQKGHVFRIKPSVSALNKNSNKV